MYMALLTKPAPTAVATDEMDLVLVEAATLGVDEDVIKSMKKKNEEAKKAQNAKKIADRKAKKPPSDPPKPPDKPEAHPAVEVLKQGLEGAMAKAEAKLLEAQTTVALMAAKDPKILTAEALLDLEETPERETVHPLIATLTEALGKAREAKAEGDICDDGQKALDDAIANANTKPKEFKGFPRREKTAWVSASRHEVMDPLALSPSVMKMVLAFLNLCLVFQCARQSLSFLLWSFVCLARSRAIFFTPFSSLRSLSDAIILF